MYEHYFNLREKPFKLLPDPDYLFLSPSHAQALSSLSYAMSQGDGFVLITGEVGTGKTTLCRCFLADLEDDCESAYIFNTQMDATPLLLAICHEFGIGVAGAESLQSLIEALNQFLMTQHRLGRKAILLIDEAQNLTVDNLEMVRLLSNLETSRDKLLHIILVGQPELAEKLEGFALRQLAQRISIRCRLMLLDRRQTQSFIEHRIQVAKGPQHLFSPWACRAIHQYARGIPRRINIAADRALFLACESRHPKVTAATARKAIRQLRSAGRKPARKGIWLMTVPAVIVLLLVGIISTADHHSWMTSLLPTRSAPLVADLSEEPTASMAMAPSVPLPEVSLAQPVPLPEALPQQTPPANEAPAPPPLPSSDSATRLSFSEKMNMLGIPESRWQALNHLLALWQQPIPQSEPLSVAMTDEQYFRVAALQYGLRLLIVKNDWSLIRRLNLPAVVTLGPNLRGESVFATLVHWRDEQADMAIGSHPIEAVDQFLLQSHATGPVYVFWYNGLGSDGIISQKTRGDEVERIKKLLRRIGYDHLSAGPIFDPPMYHAIVDFQLSRGINPDGLVGPITKIMLINAAKASFAPHLKDLATEDRS